MDCIVFVGAVKRHTIGKVSWHFKSLAYLFPIQLERKVEMAFFRLTAVWLLVLAKFPLAY